MGTFAVCIQPITDLLAEINAAKELGLELLPFWNPIILDARNINIWHKVHNASSDPQRIMSLVVSPGYLDPHPHGTERLNPSAKGQIAKACLAFWDRQEADRHVLVEVI